MSNIRESHLEASLDLVLSGMDILLNHIELLSDQHKMLTKLLPFIDPNSVTELEVQNQLLIDSIRRLMAKSRFMLENPHG